MRHGGKILLWVMCGLALSSGAFAIDADKPYAAIVDRNVFKLNPIPPANPADSATNNAPPPDLTLAGITTIFGNKRAIIKAAPKGPPKPGVPPENESYILAEGQREGDIEVLQIDERAGVVKLLLAGKPTTIDFEKNGVKLPTASPPAGVPLPGGLKPAVGGIAPPAPMATPFGNKTIPQRTLRLPGSSSTGSASFASPTAGGGIARAGISINGVGLVGASPSADSGTGVADSAQTQLSPEEQAIAIEVERERRKAEIQSGQLAPPPLTVLTPPGSPGTIPQTPVTPDPNTPAGNLQGRRFRFP